ncbi:hypothetical protein D3C77_734990 [compost metagenome]
MRIVRMDNQRHAQCFETPAGQFWTMGTGRRRQTAAKDVREIDSAFFNQPSVSYFAG